MRHDMCTEEELRDAMHLLYPHRHEASTRDHEQAAQRRNRRWKHRIHEEIQMSHKHAEDAHSHPCIEKIIPNYYESPSRSQTITNHYMQQTFIKEEHFPVT